ncbi:MAG: extracellular solute-binding protein [Halothermotrichaceae bacterium]
MLNKRIIVCVCLMIVAFFVNISAAQDWDEIIANAREEGVVYTYGTSSRVARVEKVMLEKYGIEVKHAKMSDVVITERIVREQEAGIYEVDFIMAEDIVGVAKQLLPNGYVENFVPEMYTGLVDSDYQDPLVFLVQPRTIFYNREKYDECPITNLWQLTTEEWKGKVVMRDPEITSTNVSFFAEIIARAEVMAAAYEDYFGEKIELTTENAGWEFIKRLSQNKVVTVSSDTDVANAVGASGQANPPVGFSTVGKMRMNEENGLVLDVAKKISPINGYHYPAYGLLVNRAPHPNAAKLFIRVLLTDAGAGAWTRDMGNFSTNLDNSYNSDNPLGGLSEWKEVTWPLRINTSAELSRDVIDFWIMNRN